MPKNACGSELVPWRNWLARPTVMSSNREVDSSILSGTVLSLFFSIAAVQW